MKILVIDNYDSFVYNLVHYIRNLTNVTVDVYRNDEITLDEVEKYDKILLSPGPGIPSEAGICIDVVKRYSSTKSILGVCLGHQTIGEAFGGKLINLDRPFHGIASPINNLKDDDPLNKDIPKRINVGRYHSWVVAKDGFPECLTVTSEDENGIIMGLSHKTYDVRGVQYHPESVLTEHGHKMIENWLKI